MLRILSPSNAVFCLTIGSGHSVAFRSADDASADAHCSFDLANRQTACMKDADNSAPLLFGLLL